MAPSIRKKWILTILSIGFGLCIGQAFVRDQNAQLRSEENEYMWKAMRERKYDEVLDFIRSAADINDRHVGGITPLMFAVQNDDLEMVQELLALHANVKLRTVDGKTALDIATEMHRTKMLSLLQ